MMMIPPQVGTSDFVCLCDLDWVPERNAAPCQPDNDSSKGGMLLLACCTILITACSSCGCELIFLGHKPDDVSPMQTLTIS